MIPVSLKIKGLYSFQKEQTIDFTKLTAAGLFGIFGTVGSGKSTILEAISFALYGDTQRMHSRDNRNYNMMNLKSGELSIDFEFINYDGEIYRFEIKGKRHGSDFEKVNSFDRKAYQKVNGTWQPLGAITAEAIIGLSYDNFKRTIIIPQGQFQEFIQLGDKDRVNMLKEIFQLEKYDLLLQTSILEKKNNLQLEHLKGQLSQFEHTNPAIIDAKEVELNDLKTALTVLREGFEKQQSTFKALESIQQQILLLTAKQQSLEDLQTREEEIQKEEQRLNAFILCNSAFKSTLERQIKNNGDVAELGSELKKLHDKLELSLKEYTEKQEDFKAIQEQFSTLDVLKTTLEDWKIIQQIQDKQVAIVSLRERYTKGEELKLKAQVEKDNFQGKITLLKTDIAQKKATLPDLNVLYGLKNWHLQYQTLQQNGIKTNKDILDLQTQIATIHDKIKIIISPQLIAEMDLTKSLQHQQQLLSNLKLKNNQQLQLLRDQQAQLELQAKLEEFTHQLHNHQPCPLCGSEEHPNVLVVEEVLEKQQLNTTGILACEQSLKMIDEALLKIIGWTKEEEILLNGIERAKQVLDNNADELQSHQAKHVWEKDKDLSPETIDGLLKSGQEQQQVIATLEKQLNEEERQLTTKMELLEQYKSVFEIIERELNQKTTERLTLISQLKIIAPEAENLNRDDLSLSIESQSARILFIQKQYEILREAVQDTEKTIGILKSNITGGQERIVKLQAEAAQIQEELNQKLEDTAFGSLDMVKSILDQHIDIPQLQAAIRDFRQQLFKAQTDVTELKAQLEGKTFDVDQYDTLKRTIQQTEHLLDEKNNQYQIEYSRLADLKTAFSAKEKLFEQLEKFSLRDENLRTMKKLFTASGFINFISTAYLQNLCNAANERFYKLTRQQLQLEISEKNEFQVRDFLNEGKLRSIKTLSGGQTFQAALCLALALAESIQQFSKAPRNFFFLDEGFGSQDKHSLQVVFDSLKSLKEDNRIIGIISHVEELQQEIDVYLNLENHHETGSIIKTSWEL